MSFDDAAVIDQFTKLLKAVADPSRRAILMALRHDGELSVNEIVAATSLSQPLVSQHLRVLKESKAVLAHKEGQQVYYRLSSVRVCDALTAFLQLYQEELQRMKR